MLRRPFAYALALALLAGCQPTSPAAPEAAGARPEAYGSGIDAAPEAYALDAEGFRVVEASGASTHTLPFGTSREAVVDALSLRLGAPSDQGTAEECGAGPLDYDAWDDGLTVYSQGGAFRGWALSSRAPTPNRMTTLAGLGLGTTRAELDEGPTVVEMQDSTLGEEFVTAGISGLLSGPSADATVDALWAGVSCNFR